MISENVKTLIGYRLEQADESLEAAKLLFDKSLLRPAANRSYYAMFYAVLALLAMRKLETSKHSAAISLFDKEFVKSGLFEKDFSRWLHRAFDVRQEADYKAEYKVTIDEAKTILENASSFVIAVKKALNPYLITDDGRYIKDQ